MVGGIVIEVASVRDRPDVLFVDVADRAGGPKSKNQTCAIYVEKNPTSEKIEIGDSLWWQGRFAMWTPLANRKPLCDHEHHYSCQRCGVDYDIKIPRVGYSGVTHPARKEPA